MNKKGITKEIKRIKRQNRGAVSSAKIILFGSYAYGKPDHDSDVDFLIIMPFKGKDNTRRLRYLKELALRYLSIFLCALRHRLNTHCSA